MNSTPPLLKNFSNRRLQASIPIRDLIPFGPRVSENLGFIVAEHYDFGSTKNINRLFEDLADFTPIGADDGKILDSMIFDRNLLTHHGGVYSMRYSHERNTVKTVRGGVYFDSLVVTSKDYFAHENFILELARKMSRGASDALTRWIEKSDDGDGMPLFEVQEYLNWDVNKKRRHEV